MGATLGVALLGLLLLGAAFVASGIYNVSARADHYGITTALLTVVRERSIWLRSLFIDAPPLDDPALVRLGAAHYEGGCAPCHARPGGAINPIVAGMLPNPPRLAEAAAERSPEELFWIVGNGLKYTGMPAWPAARRDDEVWALAAFLERLTDDPALAYGALAGLDRLPEADGPVGGADGRLTQCARCHDDGGRSTLSALVPRLAGQSEAYLLRALRNYAEGTRPSGIMQPVAAALPAEALPRVAAYYAELPAVAAGGASTNGNAEAGRAIARNGDPARDLPACLSCHGAGRPGFPSLAGQNGAYLQQQLRLFQRGVRGGTTHGRIMAEVAKRLTDVQATDVAAFFEGLPAAADNAATDAGQGVPQ